MNSMEILNQRDILERLLTARTEMKLEAGRFLESMDEILPLFICCLIQSKIQTPHFLANLLLDWMSSDQQAESEGQTVTLLLSAATVVAKERQGLAPIAGSRRASRESLFGKSGSGGNLAERSQEEAFFVQHVCLNSDICIENQAP